MIDIEGEDETYSLIFKSLKHPIRRKILRMLADTELTFSQILENLTIDSGHLTYHLDNLGDLITHSGDSKYKLSSFGKAAVRLMSGVEEHRPLIVPRPNGTANRVIIVFSIVLTIVLLWSSLYSIGFTTQTSSMFVRSPIGLGSPFDLGSNQTFQFNVTILYGGLHPLVSTERNGLRIVTAEQPSNTLNDWTRYFMRFDFEFNTTHEIVLSIRDPSGFLKDNGPLGGTNGSLSVGSGEYMTLAGTYEVNVQNTQGGQIEGNMAVEVWIDEFQRPLFHYGLVGIATAFSYPLIVLSAWVWRRNKPATSG